MQIGANFLQDTLMDLSRVFAKFLQCTAKFFVLIEKALRLCELIGQAVTRRPGGIGEWPRHPKINQRSSNGSEAY